MASVFRGIRRHDDLVAEPDRDLVVATRTAVRLHRLVRLHVAHFDRTVGKLRRAHPKMAHRTRTTTTPSATATIAMSLLRFTWERNGFRPTPLR